MADIKEVKIDVGCGTRKKDGCIGIDKTKYEEVDIQLDCRFNPLPFENDSVDYIYTSHFLEHLSFEEVLYIMNEFYRVLKPGKILDVIVPHGFSYSGMADLSHKTFWTEDTFGYFTPENQYFYVWESEHNGQRQAIIM
jgi:predicted SAM-dependent methyltransferase